MPFGKNTTYKRDKHITCILILKCHTLYKIKVRILDDIPKQLSKAFLFYKKYCPLGRFQHFKGLHFYSLSNLSVSVNFLNATLKELAVVGEKKFKGKIIKTAENQGNWFHVSVAA